MSKREIVLVLSNIRSLHNVGSFFRTADAFGIAKIYLCGITGTPDSLSGDKISKVALQAEKYIPWEHSKTTANILKRLKKDGFQIVALEQDKNSIELRKARFREKVALVVGNEVKGVSKSILKNTDLIVEIPMHGQKESLNVSVAGGIALYQIKSG